MARPELVAECVASISAVVKVPVTVKHRIGIDDRDSYDDMYNFVNTVSVDMYEYVWYVQLMVCTTYHKLYVQLREYSKC